MNEDDDDAGVVVEDEDVSVPSANDARLRCCDSCCLVMIADGDCVLITIADPRRCIIVLDGGRV